MNSCHKELFTTHGALSFSTDTLTFDTVFTSLGSTTKSFVIRNTQSRDINISDIKILQLQGTQFRIRILPDIARTEYTNVVVPAHDSLYVFVEVTINPTAANNPFVILDKVQFITNGITQTVALEAMGQNAYYYFSYEVKRGTVFNMPADKPNIIVNKNGGLPIFAVDTGATLNIPPRCQIFMGPGAVMTVDGTLNAHGGDWSDSIVFQYIRTDYPNQPGLWLGITTSRIAHVSMDHVIIDQSTFGLSDEYVLDAIAQQQITTSNIHNYVPTQLPVDSLNDVIIRNSSSSALTILCANFTATNCLFFSAGGYLATFGLGGSYNLTHCTLANCYSTTQSSQNQCLTVLSQIYSFDMSQIGPFTTTANFNNTIVAGNMTNEVTIAQPLSSIAINFRNCFLTTPADSFFVYQTNLNGCIDTAGDPQLLQPALFMSPQTNNYMPDSASIVLGKVPNPPVPYDLYGYTRPNPASIGAIEYHH